MAVIINGDTGIDKITDGSIVAADIGTGEVGATQLASTLDLSGKTVTLATDAVDQLSTASGSAPSYSARAWINMDGTGTISIRGSGNVSSIADNGTGDYTVNFATNMSGTNYNVVGSSNHNTSAANSRMFFQSMSTLRLTSSVRVRALGDGGSALDVDTVDFCIFE